MNKFLRIVLAILFLLIVVVYPSRYKIGAFYYGKINPNDSIKILTFDQDNANGYNDIFKIASTNKTPSFIYFNTRYSYDRLISDKIDLLRLDSLFKSDKLNMVYIANGLDDEPSEKDKWIVMINKLNLIGTHISLPDDFPDFDSFFKYTKWDDKGHRTTSIPHYLLTNSLGMITDTIYDGKIDIDKIKLISEK